MSIIINLAKKWSKLSHFVWNHIGGVFAVCSITDFKNAVAAKFIGGGMVMVQETLVFSNLERVNRHMSQSIIWDGGELRTLGADFYPRYKADNLFVPFASERHLSFVKQEKFFIKPEKPREFKKRKKLENLENDYRLQFADKWVDDFGEAHDLLNFRDWIAIGILIYGIVFASIAA